MTDYFDDENWNAKTGRFTAVVAREDGRRMSEREDVEALMGTLWPGKYDNWTRTWDWCGCVAPASEHFAPGFCPLLGLLATHDEQVRAEVLAPVRALAEEWWNRTPAFLDVHKQHAAELLDALPPERPAGEVGAE